MSTVSTEISEAGAVASDRSQSYELIKPWLDFVLALAMFPVAVPIVLVAMLLIKLNSRGSGIYTQKRVGFRGKIFTIYKIRTMYENSESDSGPIWALHDDRRVTPIGRFLRDSHIDELPQLINVLKGEMSLVGPRPERPEFVPELERALPNYRQRLAVRPGLTGLAQVQLPPDSDLLSVRRKLNCDVCYVERTSLWLDMRLLFGTIFTCAGTPFGLVGRILRLPDPNSHLLVDSQTSKPDITAGTLLPSPNIR
jgi:lipopolysaccharide/colanic/teichoic acid biosynthesis glycosyltransferase